MNVFRSTPANSARIACRIPPDREAATASYNNDPAADGSRAGWVNFNTYQPTEQVKYDKEAVILHEGVPGRHLVDTGIHALGWSREQAVEYFKAHAPSKSLAEVDRYIAWPGQALAYKLGQLKIRELRVRAERTLGASFDIRDFHDAVLRNGALPFDLWDEQVNLFIHASDVTRR